MSAPQQAGTSRLLERGVPAAVARSWLLRPATAIEGDTGRPDVLVLDLEDAVAEADKDAARAAVVDHLARARAWVRINDAATPHWQKDLDALAGAPGLAGIVLAKTESAADARRTAALLPRGTRIVPMVESASSLEQAEEIARESSTFRIAFGVGDFRRDTGISADPIALAPVRSRLVVASVAAGIRPPIDGPTRGSAEVVLVGVQHGRAMGMTGALVLDLSLVPVVHSALSPTEAEVAWAREVLASSSGGDRDGSYAPTRARATDVLELHEQFVGGARE